VFDPTEINEEPLKSLARLGYGCTPRLFIIEQAPNTAIQG